MAAATASSWPPSVGSTAPPSGGKASLQARDPPLAQSRSTALPEPPLSPAAATLHNSAAPSSGQKSMTGAKTRGRRLATGGGRVVVRWVGAVATAGAVAVEEDAVEEDKAPVLEDAPVPTADATGRVKKASAPARHSSTAATAWAACRGCATPPPAEETAGIEAGTVAGRSSSQAQPRVEEMAAVDGGAAFELLCEPSKARNCRIRVSRRTHSAADDVEGGEGVASRNLLAPR